MFEVAIAALKKARSFELNLMFKRYTDCFGMKIAISVLLVFLLFNFCSSQDHKQKNCLEIENLKGNIKEIKVLCYIAMENDDYQIVKAGNCLTNTIIGYNEKGNRIDYNQFDSTGNLLSRHTYKYDDIGNQLEENWYNPDSSLYFKALFKYDGSGNPIEENDCRPDGSLRAKWLFTYDAEGNKIKEEEYDSNGTLSYNSTYKYNTNRDNIKEINRYSDNKMVTIYKYSYDAYDKQVNWTEQVKYADDLPIFIVLREITYYD